MFTNLTHEPTSEQSPKQNAPSKECTHSCRKQCQARKCKKNQKKQPSSQDISGHIGTFGDIISSHGGEHDSSMLYNDLVQHAKQMSVKERLMPAKQVADILGICDKTIHRWGYDAKVSVRGGEKSKRFDILECLKVNNTKRAAKKKSRKKGKTE